MQNNKENIEIANLKKKVGLQDLIHRLRINLQTN